MPKLPGCFRLRLGLGLLVALACATAAHAATFTVTTAADEFDTPSGAALSLREALRDAAALAGADTIVFANSFNIVLGSEIVVGDTNVTVDATALAAGVTVDGGVGANRILSVSAGANVTLLGLTLTGGNVLGGSGGAILNRSTLTLTHCTLSGNSARDAGGAIFNSGGTLTLTHCTLSGNSANDSGGAIENGGGTLALTHCTLSDNSAGNGGGIENFIATLRLTNSIVAGNTATGTGADIYNDFGTITRVGANLVQSLVNAFGGTDSGTAAITAPPLLAPLAAYGGPTMTMALRPGSPARDAATNSTVTSDQRGFPIVGIRDIGAYEAGTLLDYDAFIWETLPTTNVAAHAAGFDYDGDGRLNAAEYATLSDPSATNAGPALVFTPNAAGTVGTNTFAIRAGASDLIYQLARGTTVTNLTNIVVVNPATLTTNTFGPGLTLTSSGSTLTVTDTNLTGRAQMFYQLKVQLTP